jgi:molecular chaperone DnaK (HSP70)
MRLGIDFGICFASAAFMDGGTLSFVKDPLSVSFSVPCSAFANAQGQVLVGKTANNRRLSDPLRYRRKLKRGLGKTDPLLLGTHPFSYQSSLRQMEGKTAVWQQTPKPEPVNKLS